MRVVMGDTDSAEKAMSTNVSETVICADGVNAEMAMNWEESGCGDNLQRVISGDTDIDR